MEKLVIQKLLGNLFKGKKKKEIRIASKETQILHYKRRFYNTWSSKEIGLLIREIRRAVSRNESINLTKIRRFMPYRSISSIRCKTRECCALIQVSYSTYTCDDNNNGKD